MNIFKREKNITRRNEGTKISSKRSRIINIVCVIVTLFSFVCSNYLTYYFTSWRNQNSKDYTQMMMRENISHITSKSKDAQNQIKTIWKINSNEDVFKYARAYCYKIVDYYPACDTIKFGIIKNNNANNKGMIVSAVTNSYVEDRTGFITVTSMDFDKDFYKNPLITILWVIEHEMFHVQTSLTVSTSANMNKLTDKAYNYFKDQHGNHLTRNMSIEVLTDCMVINRGDLPLNKDRLPYYLSIVKKPSDTYAHNVCAPTKNFLSESSYK